MFQSVRRVAPGAVCVLFCTQWGLAAGPWPVPPPDPVRINFELSALGGDRWQYTYEVANISLGQPISEFTVWFDRNTQGNLSISTPNPPSAGWSELVAQPVPFLQLDGFYDALSLAGGIPSGSHVWGFAVAFDWLGTGKPGAQRFEIIDPANAMTLYQGQTVPEPVSLILLWTAALFSRRRH
ncbi:MAG: hypothetical protein AMXMBFR13_29970 [Phycisphaerae bacterium]